MAGPSIALPDKRSFPFKGTYLDAAYTHPLGVHSVAAGRQYLDGRLHNPYRQWPEINPRDAAVQLFADLINVDPATIAVVPSTMDGENLIVAAVGLGPAAGVATDAFHYDASLAMYGELHRRGIPVSVVRPRNNRIELSDLESTIHKTTRLVSVSLISSITGFEHDLKRVCDIAHSKGALVYADIIQAAGAIPIDVQQTGVDFCCCGTYKWLMGDFGTAFLYVRPDRLHELRRVQFGWRQFSDQVQHVYPFNQPGPAIGTWKLGVDTISHFEVGTPDWAALSIAVASLSYIQQIGVDAIQQYRQPMVDFLQNELPEHGFAPLTPQPSRGPSVSFSFKDARSRLAPILRKARVQIGLYEHAIRISPSVYNDMDDIVRLFSALTQQ
jgi:selenocysteine lyase/cysteine desulfurase